MPEVTISPVPFNGGSLIPGPRRHMCRLTDTRYFCAYGQTSPFYTLGMVVSIDNIRSASPAATVLRTQSIPEITLPSAGSGLTYKVARLNDTQVIIAVQTLNNTTISLSVLDIDPVTNIITVVGNTISLAAAATLDSLVTASGFQPLADNVVAFVYTNNTAQHTAVRVTWNPATLTLTNTNVIHTLNPGGETNRIVGFTKIQDSGNWVYHLAASSSNTVAGYSTRANVSAPAASTTAWTSIGPSAINNSTATQLHLDSSRSLYMVSPNTWRYYVGSVITGSDTAFCVTPPATTGHRPFWATWLGTNIFMVRSFSAASTSTPYYPATGGIYTRVARYTNPSFGDTSPATVTNLLQFNTGWIHDLGILGSQELVPAGDVILNYGRDSATNAFRIGITHANAV